LQTSLILTTSFVSNLWELSRRVSKEGFVDGAHIGIAKQIEVGLVDLSDPGEVIEEGGERTARGADGK